MEHITIKNLPDGTLAYLKAQAAKAKHTFFNGKPNMQGYIRTLLEKPKK